MIEVDAGSGVFASAVTEAEWSEVPAEIAKKLRAFVEGKFDELFASKALLETYKYNAGICPIARFSVQ